ncbi:OprD family porin [Pragia fontium]|nr:OprD family porin [Pragia fontium]
MKKIIGPCLIASLMSLTANATSSDKNNTASPLANNPFFQDAKLDISTRNYWKYLKEDESQPKEVHSAWGQNVILKFESGYFADFIGFDATYTGVIKLAASDYFSTRALLYNDGPGFDKSNAAGFNKMGERYVKIKYALDDLKFNARGGWQIIKNTGILTASNRLSQNSYLGYSGQVSYENLSLDAVYVTSSINRDAPDKVHFLTKDNRVIDNIISTGLNYKDKELSAAYFYGEADNYLRRHGMELSYRANQHLTLGSQIYGTYALDDYKSMSASRKEFDNHAWHYAFDAKWQQQKWGNKLGIAYTRAEKNNAIGYYARHVSKNMRGRFNAMTSAGSDYMRDGELALSTATDYLVTPDLKMGLLMNYGQFDYKSNTVRTGEVNVFGHWIPKDNTFKNLSIFAMFGPGWSYKHKNRTPTLYNGDVGRAHNLAGEIIIDYKFNLF